MLLSGWQNFAIGLLVAAALYALAIQFYLSWFRPQRFLSGESRRVKAWWPFASFFRRYYGSAFWLWCVRIVTAAFLPLVLIVLVRVLDGDIRIP